MSCRHDRPSLRSQPDEEQPADRPFLSLRSQPDNEQPTVPSSRCARSPSQSQPDEEQPDEEQPDEEQPDLQVISDSDGDSGATLQDDGEQRKAQQKLYLDGVRVRAGAMRASNEGCSSGWREGLDEFIMDTESAISMLEESGPEWIAAVILMISIRWAEMQAASSTPRAS